MNFLTSKEVTKKTGLSRVTIWRLERKDLFPKRFILTERRVGWREDHINKWIVERKEVNGN
jgi:predicted DNA-binding transcriptional regulator AlpA